jgi:glucose-1-phosphate thymidylyltransferase
MELIGLLPCAGQGLRMRPLKYPKELLPVSYYRSPIDNFIIPRLSIEYSLDAFKLCGVKKCYIVVPDWKPEIMRYLGDGAQIGINIAYLHNSRANGLADAVFSMEPWGHDIVTCLALPDAQFTPTNAFDTLLHKMQQENADLVLGVFPTDEPQFLAPVELNSMGRVINVEEKPLQPKFMNAWGIAIWKESFWSFFKHMEKSNDTGISISEVFHKAAQKLRVFGVYFDQGSYHDIGRYESLSLVFKSDAFVTNQAR